MLSHDLVACYLPLPASLQADLAGDPYEVPEFANDSADHLKGFRAALVTSHGPELPEFHVPLRYLRDRGASVEVVAPDWLFGPEKGEASGLVALAQFLAVNVCVKADKRISDAKAEDYDAVIILGGAWNPIVLRTESQVLQFIVEVHAQRKLIAAICHGPQVLISAKASPAGIASKAFPAGTRATGVKDIRDDLANADFVVEADKQVVYDEPAKLITSPGPQRDALKAFCEEIGRHARLFVSRNA